MVRIVSSEHRQWEMKQLGVAPGLIVSVAAGGFVDEGMLVLGFLVPLSIVTIGGVLLILMAMYQRTKTIEMQHRERLAMIERGLAPEPARDPVEFERWQQFDERTPHSGATSLGVVIVALGLGLMLIIGFAAREAAIGVGIGGSIVVLGTAFIVIGELKRRSQPPARRPGGYSATPPRPLGPSDRSGPVGP
jgi:hypothetical protein